MPRTVKPRRPVVQRSNPLARGLRLALPFWERGGTTVRDVSGWGNHAAFAASTAAPSWAVGRPGPGVRFDGVNDTADIPDAASLRPSGQITFEVLFTISGVGNGADFNAPLIKGSYTNNGYGFLFHDDCLATSGAVNCYTPGIGSISWTASLALNTLYHWVGTASSAARLLYSNGVLRQSGAGGALSVGTQVLHLGGLAANNYFLQGDIYHVRVWDRVLAPWQVRLACVDPWGLYERRSARETLAKAAAAAALLNPYYYRLLNQAGAI